MDGATTQDEAGAALAHWRSHADLADLLGVPAADVPGPRFARSVGVSASPPDYRDHFIHVSVPAATDVSRIPREVLGVRVVVDLLDSPGPIAYGPDRRLGPRR